MFVFVYLFILSIFNERGFLLVSLIFHGVGYTKSTENRRKSTENRRKSTGNHSFLILGSVSGAIYREREIDTAIIRTRFLINISDIWTSTLEF